MARLDASLIEHIAQPHRDAFRVGEDERAFVLGQGGEQMILPRVFRSEHVMCPWSVIRVKSQAEEADGNRLRPVLIIRGHGIRMCVSRQTGTGLVVNLLESESTRVRYPHSGKGR